MSLIDLQTTLLNEIIRDELDELTKRMVVIEIDNLAPAGDAISIAQINWARLLLAGSILARSDQRPHLEAALRIATAAVILSTNEAVKDAGTVLLGKLSNFRAITLADKRELLTVDLDGRLGMSLRIEAQRRQMDQAILIESGGRWLPVNGNCSPWYCGAFLKRVVY